MLRELVKKYPYLHITYLTSKFCAPVIQSNSNINAIITYDMPSMKGLIRSPISLMSLLLLLRKKSFDVTIVTHRSFYAILFAYLIGSPVRIGFNYKKRGYLLSERILLRENKYAPELYMGLLQDICDDTKDLGLELNLSSEDRMFAKNVFSNIQGDIIAIAPGGGRNMWMDILPKRWPVEGYAEIISHLIKKHNVLLLGSKEDITISNAAKESIPFPVIDLTGKTTLRQAASLLQRCSLFVGNDSSLLHIAAAVGTPTISIFGPTNPEFFAPKGEKHITIKSDAHCSPCFTYGKLPKCEDHICMKSIKADVVLSAINKILNQ
jgi:lipopolysaccharide heptosyltransferase II